MYLCTLCKIQTPLYKAPETERYPYHTDKHIKIKREIINSFMILFPRQLIFFFFDISPNRKTSRQRAISRACYVLTVVAVRTMDDIEGNGMVSSGRLARNNNSLCFNERTLNDFV